MERSSACYLLRVLLICLQCAIDRNQSLYCDRTIGSSLLACEAEEPERGNDKVGVTYGCGELDLSTMGIHAYYVLVLTWAV